MSALDIYAAPLRSFISAEFRSTRKEMGLTQAQMADLLCIDWRSYLDLEHGKSLCCTRVFILFMIHCKPDHSKFIEDLSNILKQIENNMSE